MRTKILGLVLSIFFFLGGTPGPVSAKKMTKTFKNPILTGFHPDPSVCRVGNDFYLVNSTFEYFPGLPIYHSRDLVHWKQIGNALDRPSQLPLKGATDGGGLYAPTIRYHKGTFYLTCTNVSGNGNFIVKATDPAGPWSEPIWMNVPDIDGSMFFDDDGKAYFTNQGGGEKAGIKQCEFDPETCQALTDPRNIYNDTNESWNEGPHLYKIKGLYYLMLAEGGTGDQHAEFIGRSKSPWGPFEPCPHNPILTERDDPKSPIQCTGHADLFDAPDGSWWVVFLGTRPHNGMSVLGRETFLAPVHWTKDGWPVVGKEHHVALEMEAPKLKVFPVETPPSRTEFNTATLGPEWIHVRNYDPKNFSLESRPGYLRIMAAKDSLDRKSEEPAFVGQRQPDFRLSVRTSMEFAPAQDGEEAGLCVRANDDNHYEIAVGRFGGKTRIFARNRVKCQSFIIAQKPLDSGNVQLEISGTEDQYQFAYSTDGKTWTTLAASPSGDLSREKAGGFTGTAIGLYASANGKESQAYADFNWFEVLPGVVPEQISLSPRPTPTPLVATDSWRIRAGGTGFRDKKGQEWSDDVGYSEGETALTYRPIAGSDQVELYQTERWGQNFSYTLPVPPGKYQVHLRFCETYVHKEGERVFDILINGVKVLANFDILKEAKAFDTAVDKTFKDIQPDSKGQVNIQFVSSVQNAKVCSIEVTKQK
ncbi:MAG TPA: family 43 glycosylhydrolase [bacterium]|nr:family 43 glycosylhydrolase [bacterium]